MRHFDSLALVVLIALTALACGGTSGPTSTPIVDEGPDPFAPAGGQSRLGAPAGVVPVTADSTRACNPQIQYLSGACADGPGSAPTHAQIQGSCFTPNTEVPLVMSPNTNGWIKGGTICAGTVFEVGEPFVLPPTWAVADAAGDFQVTVTGQECMVEALDTVTCETSNVATLPPVD